MSLIPVKILIGLHVSVGETAMQRNFCMTNTIFSEEFYNSLCTASCVSEACFNFSYAVSARSHMSSPALFYFTDKI